MRRLRIGPDGSHPDPERAHTATNVPFYLLIAGAYSFLTIPRMAQAGMFLDGVTYAAISRNLAEGLGTFWAPSYTSTLFRQFWEHPPLGFALQAAAFAVFGDHLAVERAYSFVAGGVTAVATVFIWRTATRDVEHDWVPLVFWLLPSTVTWSIVNNMLETTQTAFTTGAVLTFVLSLQSARAPLVWAIASGLCICAAVLTKGPTGFFPLAAPLIAAFTLRSGARAVKSGIAMLITAGTVFTALIALKEPGAALHAYWVQQVQPSISGARGGGRWRDLARHLSGIIMRMGVVSALAFGYGHVMGRTREGEGRRASTAWVWFFVLLALAASIPLAVSGRVMGQYLVPAIPIYALAFAALSVPVIGPTLRRWRAHPLVDRLVRAAGVLLLVLAVVFAMLGVTLEHRDVSRIAAYRSLSSSIPRGSTIATCEALREDWGVHAYMQRFFRVSLDAGLTNAHRLFLQVTDRTCDVPPACHLVNSAPPFALFECEGAVR